AAPLPVDAKHRVVSGVRAEPTELDLVAVLRACRGDPADERHRDDGQNPHDTAPRSKTLCPLEGAAGSQHPGPIPTENRCSGSKTRYPKGLEVRKLRHR